ncbi:thiolase family protein [Dermatobacter hominis]|uniref:thiolase family protein n=1 Tax=Dermatobacter hominis TaxID=2884263 RepID=UPI001D12D4CF|nr:thiolase family protein [Dermatobacter hominis]UDY35141.1 thiolase family protein [Dermatobacter hominis]
MTEAVIVDAVRTPLGKGKPGGALAGVHAVDLLAHPLAALLERNDLDGAVVDDVIVGAVSQVGEQGVNVARRGALAAGYPERVPATTVDRQCGSSQQAISFAAQGVLAGAYDLVVAGGVESMSRVPMGSSAAGTDDLDGERLSARYPDGFVPQGVAAELIAARWDLDRRRLDEFGLRSQELAAAARAEGRFDGEIAPIKVADGDGGLTVVSSDEGIRETSLDRLGALRPAFEHPYWSERFPQIRWSVTAGTSSQLTDGAAAVLVASRERADALGLPVRAVVRSTVVEGDDPLFMLTGVIPATRKLLDRAGLGIDDIDLFEVNEAFAPVVLAWADELGADLDRVNVHGGAIALGHPLGASGTRLATTLVNAMEQRDARFGLQVMCEAGGLANATLYELAR